MIKTPQLNTPILLIGFNRPDTLKKVFSAIKKQRPKKLFFAVDGPRKGNKNDKKNSKKVKDFVKKVDWPCEVKTLFRKENLGCKYAVSSAIDWFFDNVEQGIILEDDCLPDQSFFRFCQEMLEKYKNDNQIMSISGTNFLDQYTENMKESYYFSRIILIWGWATWKRAWNCYDVEVHKTIKLKDILKNSKGIIEFLQDSKRLHDVKTGKTNTWDSQLGFLVKKNKKLNIIPKINLVKNIGFSDNLSTHTKENKWDTQFLNKNLGEMIFPLNHPKKIIPHKKLDKKYILFDLKRSILKKLF